MPKRKQGRSGLVAMRLRAYKNEHSLKWAEVAAQLGVTEDAVHRWTRYENAITLRRARKLAALLGLTVEQVLTDFARNARRRVA